MTLEEIIAKAKESPELQKSIVMWAKDTDQGKEVLTNFANVEIEKKIKDETSKLYTGIDNDIFEILGSRKKNDQKTYDFVKEVVTELKKLKADKGGDKDVKLKELTDEIKKMQDEGSVNEHWKKIYEEALLKWTGTEKELKDSITAKEGEYLTAQVLADLNSGVSSLKIKDGIPKEAVDAMIKVHQEEILKGAKFIDGKVVYHKEDGTPWMNGEYKAISSLDIWGEKLGTLIDKDGSSPKGGGGANPKLGGGSIVKTGEGDNAKTKLVLDKDKFSTRVEFQKLAQETLNKQGILEGSKEFNDVMVDAYKEYEVSGLDMQ